jgi:hypothetical protein
MVDLQRICGIWKIDRSLLQYAVKNSDAGPLRPSDRSGKFSAPDSGEKNIRAHLARVGPNRSRGLANPLSTAPVKTVASTAE